MKFYEEDLPNPALVAIEILRWKAKWEGQSAEDRPSSLRKKCDMDFFPQYPHTVALGLYTSYHLL